MLFSWKLLPPPSSPSVSSELEYPSVVSFTLFPHWLFCRHSIAFMKGLLGTCLWCSWTLRPFLSLHRFSPCSSILILRNQSALITRYIYRGFRAAVLKYKIVEEFKLQRGSHSVESVWIENFGVTYCSLKWMFPPVNSWVSQTLQNMIHFKTVKCLLCPLWKKLYGINKSKEGLLLFSYCYCWLIKHWRNLEICVHDLEYVMIWHIQIMHMLSQKTKCLISL